MSELGKSYPIFSLGGQCACLLRGAESTTDKPEESLDYAHSTYRCVRQ
jgi:hypothetical protein